MEHTNMTLLRAGVCKNIWMRILLGVSGSQYPPKSFQRTTLTLRKRFQVASWCDVTRTTTLLEHSKPQHTIHHLKSGRSIMLCIWQSEMLDCLREMQTNKQFNFKKVNFTFSSIVHYFVLHEIILHHISIYKNLFWHLILSFMEHVCVLSHVQLFGTPWTALHQVPLSVELFRQEYWSG